MIRMNEHTLRLILEGKTRSPLAAAMRTALWLPGKLYGLAMRTRRAAYRHGVYRSERPTIPTISIGNLTAGGSGKTPFTVMLANYFIQTDRIPAILLRGYRQDGNDNSDEAALYRDACPRAVVEVNPDRRAGARAAARKNARVILMDDGFQHLKLRRNLDIVLVDATSPWGGGNTIPGGLLREPKSALQYAHIVAVTRSDQVPEPMLTAIRREITALNPTALLLSARHAPTRLYGLDQAPLPLTALKGRPVLALSGIARPEAFHKTLQQLGAVVVASVTGRDHEHFSAATIAEALQTAANHGATVVITEKDRGKKIFAELADTITSGDDIWTVGVDQEVDDPKALFSLVEQIMAGANA